jgi:hypothetical protein
MFYLIKKTTLKLCPPTPKGGVPLNKRQKYQKMNNFSISRVELPLWVGCPTGKKKSFIFLYCKVQKKKDLYVKKTQ